MERQLEELLEDRMDQQIEDFQESQFEQGRRRHLGMADADDEPLDEPHYEQADDEDDEDDEDDGAPRSVAVCQEPAPPILDDELAADEAALMKAMVAVVRRDASACLGRWSLAHQEQAFHDQLRSHDQAKFDQLSVLRSRAWEEEALAIARWAYDQGKRGRPTND